MVVQLDDSAFTKEVRVRFAPSPTGWMHIGSIRQIIYNYLWAKKYGGTFVLRIEDTDVKRTVEGGIDSIYETFDAFEIEVDEGPKQGGPFGPYVQSERLDLYEKFAKELIVKDAAYYCFCSKERLEKVREEQIRKKIQPKYDGHCRSLLTEEVDERIKNGEERVVRLKVPRTGVTEYEDVLHGKIKFKNALIDDQVLLKSDGFPTYHFAAVVDDHLMKISHVIRGEEYVSSAPKVVLMYKALGWDMPYLVQTPNVLNPDGKKKLSKRGGSNTAHKFLRKGYLVEGLWNFLVLLGWAPTGSEGNPDEIYTKDDLVKLFDLRRIKKAGARFLPEKLDHFNGYYIRQMSVEDLADRVFEWADQFVLKDFIADGVVELDSWEKKLREDLSKYLPIWKEDREYFHKALSLEQDRLTYLSELPGMLDFFYDASLTYDIEDFKSIPHDDVAGGLKGLWKVLQPIVTKSWKHETWERAIRDNADTLGWKHGELFMALRIAITGRKASPPLYECMELMGVERCSARVADAIKFLSK